MIRYLLAILIVLLQPFTMPGTFQDSRSTFWGNPGNLSAPAVRTYHFVSCGGATLPGGCNPDLEAAGWMYVVENTRIALRNMPTLSGVVLDNPFGKWVVDRPDTLETVMTQYPRARQRAVIDPRYAALTDPFAFRNVMKRLREVPREAEFGQARDLEIVVYIGWPPETMTVYDYEESLSIFAGLPIVHDGESYDDPNWTHEERAARQGRYQMARACERAHGSRWQATEAFPSEGSALCSQPSYATAAVVRYRPDVPYLTGNLFCLWRGDAADGTLADTIAWVQQDPTKRSLVVNCLYITPADRAIIGGSHE